MADDKSGKVTTGGPAAPGAPEPKSHVRVYDAPEKKGTPAWMWLLPVLALLGLGLWWFNRSDDSDRPTTERTDALKPDAGGATTAANWTATGIADSIRRTGRVSLGDSEVHFATNSAKLEGDSQAVLVQVAQALKDNPDWRMRVVGHTDASGSAGANMQLASKRAESVATYLTSQGVEQSHVRPVQESGEGKPVADNATDAGRAANRRVELIKE